MSAHPIKHSLAKPNRVYLIDNEYRIAVVKDDGRGDPHIDIVDLHTDSLVNSNRASYTLIDVNAIVPYSNGCRAIVTTRRGVQIWDIEKCQRISKLMEFRSYEVNAIKVNAVTTFDNDQKAIFVYSDGVLQIWDLENMRPVGDAMINGHSNTINGITVFDQGKHAVSVSTDYTLRIWDLRRYCAVGEAKNVDGLMLCSEKVSNIEMFDYRSKALAILDNGSFKIWDINNQKLLDSLALNSISPYSPKYCKILDDQLKAIMVYPGYPDIFIVDMKTSTVCGKLKGAGEVMDLAVFDKGRRIATVSQEDGKLRIWDIQKRKLIRRPIYVSKGIGKDLKIVSAVAVMPDELTVVTCSVKFSSSDIMIRMWNVESGKPVGDPIYKTFGFPESEEYSSFGVKTIVALSDNRHIITTWTANSMRVWDLKESCEVGLPFGTGSVIALFDEDRRVLSANQNELEVWDLESHKLVGETLKGHKAKVRAIRIVDNGSRAVSASEDRTIRLWDLSPYCS